MDKQHRKDKIIAAIKETHGLLTVAAAKAGISRTTLWRYTKEFPTVQQAVDDAKEEVLDFAESMLYTAMKGGNIAAIIFFLKTQGKQRGFIERSEITGAEGTPLLNVHVSKPETKEDIAAILARLSAN